MDQQEIQAETQEREQSLLQQENSILHTKETDQNVLKKKKIRRLNLILFGLGIFAFMVIVFLAIFLPLYLTRNKELRKITPQCPDGKFQPLIDCLPDKNFLLSSGQNLELACQQRQCCWSAGAGLGGPNCVFHFNYGFRKLKTKQSNYPLQWFELARLNSPISFAQSDILNIEVKVEMQTDQRLRIKIFPRRNFKNLRHRWEVPSDAKGENIFKPLYRVEYTEVPFAVRVIRNSTNQVM